MTRDFARLKDGHKNVHDGEHIASAMIAQLTRVTNK